MLVIKIGGSIVPEADALLDEIAQRPEPVVLVHGFGPQTDAACEERSIPVRTLRSPDGVTSRFTDDAVLGAMEEAARRTRERLIQRLTARGVETDRLGLDVPIVWGEAKPVLRHARADGRVLLVRGNRSGRVSAVEPAPVRETLQAGATPVVTPLAMGPDGRVSVDADRAAAALAGALGADELVLLTDVAHVRDASGEPLARVDLDEVEHLVASGTARGGMVRKLVAGREALEAGVGTPRIADGRRERPVARALAGESTEVTL